jgi:hypothetical protein
MLIGLLLLPLAGYPDQTCLKLVFNRYCLGGDVNQWLHTNPQPLVRHPQGERLALIYPENRERVYVLAFRGQIYKVLRRYRQATQLKYEDLYALLRDKYGLGEDRSEFPEYALNAASRLGAIRRGEGRATHVWEPQDAPWHIELNWTREMGLTLAYIADALDEQQQRATEQGY